MKADRRLDQYAAVSGTSYSYDLNGNLLSDGLRSFTYSSENQLLTATTLSGGLAEYSYGPAARRVRKTVDGVGTDYLHAGNMEIAEYDSVSGELLRRYIPGSGVDQRVVMVDCGTSANCRAREAGTETDYYHADRQGNVLAVTRAGADALVQQFFYTPFGVELVGDASGNPFRYTGRRFDPETGLYYYRARYYDPDLGRFLQVDPVGYEDQWNLYAYVGNNPLNATDPSGMWGCGTRLEGRGSSAACASTDFSQNFVSREDSTAGGTAAQPPGRGGYGVPRGRGHRAGNIPNRHRSVQSVNGQAVRGGRIGPNSGVTPARANRIARRLGYDRPPFDPNGRNPMIGRARGTQQYVRVHNGAEQGRFLTDPSEIVGRTPAQIRERLALDYTPTQIQVVTVPRGTRIIHGPAGPQPTVPGAPQGGAYQYMLIGRIPRVSFGPSQPIPPGGVVP